MNHYITNIHIDHVRHLKDVNIELKKEKKSHLILTGKNGSGKTSLLEAIKENLISVNNGERHKVYNQYQTRYENNKRQLHDPAKSDIEKQDIKRTMQMYKDRIEQATAGLLLSFCNEDDIEPDFQNGKLITAYFPANRLTKIDTPRGAEDVKLNEIYPINLDPVKNLIKYMVHLKTQQAYAKNEGDLEVGNKVQNWMNLFQDALRKLMDDETISLQYDYRNYNFMIHQDGRNPYDFTQLSDGYSAAIRIVADLMMRMDKNWLMNDSFLDLTTEGIALIDEIETHLHLELQRSILPFLTELFPNIQFIVTTHSPFVVGSLADAVIFDLENRIIVSNGLTNVTYEGIVEGYFRSDALSETLRKKYDRYRELVCKTNLTDDDYDEIMDLELYLDEIPDYLSLRIATDYQKLKLEFNEREDKA